MSLIKKAFLLAAGLSFLVGCGSSSSSNSTAPVDNTPQSDPAPAEESLYRPALVALIPGSYTGTCVTYPDNQVSTAAVVVSSAGDVTAPGATGSLMGYGVTFTFERKFTAGAPVTASFSTTDLTNSSGLNLVLRSGDSVAANSVSARQGLGSVPGLFCANSKETVALKTKSLYGSVGKFFLTPKKTINCTSNNVAKPLDLTIGVNSAQIGDENFSFTTGLRQEVAAIISTVNNLVYIAKTEDGREFSVTVDKKGVLNLLHFKNKAGALTNCVP